MAFRLLLLLLLFGITTCAPFGASQANYHFPLHCEEENLKAFITRWRRHIPGDTAPAPSPHITVRRLGSSTSTSDQLFRSCREHFESKDNILLGIINFVEMGRRR